MNKSELDQFLQQLVALKSDLQGQEDFRPVGVRSCGRCNLGPREESRGPEKTVVPAQAGQKRVAR